MSIVEFDEERAEIIFDLLTYFWRMARPFIKLPQDQMILPTNASPREIANYLYFLAIVQRGGVISDTPSDRIHELYAKRPDIFDPVEVVKLTREEIRAILNSEDDPKRPLAYKIDEFSEAWLKNAELLVAEFGANALNLVDAPDFLSAYDRVRGRLYGIRMKIFSLFVIWLQERELLSRFQTVPPPIDFHALRLLMSTGVVKTAGLEDSIPERIRLTKAAEEYPMLIDTLVGRPGIRVNERLTDAVAIGCMKLIEEFGYTHLDINPGMWTFSRNMCSKAKQNAVSRRHSLLLDPEVLRTEPGLWGKAKDPCEVCIMAEYCDRVFPSEPYYRLGLLVPIVRLNRSEGLRLIYYPREDLSVRFRSLVRFLTRNGNGKHAASKKEALTEQYSLFIDP